MLLNHIKKNVCANHVVLAFTDDLLTKLNFPGLQRLHLNVGAMHTAQILDHERPFRPVVACYDSLDVSWYVAYFISTFFVVMLSKSAKKFWKLSPSLRDKPLTA